MIDPFYSSNSICSMGLLTLCLSSPYCLGFAVMGTISHITFLDGRMLEIAGFPFEGSTKIGLDNYGQKALM